MSTLLIGISGKIGAGKDTVAEMIINHPIVAGNCTVIRFADRLKEVVALLTGTSREANYSRSGKQLVPEAFAPFSLGILQQKVGMALRESLDEDIWVMALDVEVKKCKHLVIIPDVRFVNEFDYVRRNGGIVVRVNRDNRPVDNRDAQHISETALDNADFDVVIDNNGTLDDLAKQVHEKIFL